MDWSKLFLKIFGTNSFKFKEVHIDQEVIDSILWYAQSSDPNEFIALFDGKIEKEILHIFGLIFLPGESSGEGAIMNTGMLPTMTHNWGSVHSHPGPSAMPSETDLFTFARMGLFHMIICRPYEEENIMSYNRYGESADFQIIP
ncbi:Mov34/MPN/PAD-1 family protein [Methanobrevibacter cuticularis]|uniref:Mov34/MPN/PAD-1 family protein n=1 Tax=Methanobrevibacter cuticularis TaxID=47311 RepID=A0A166E4U1_9EURY|nr:Mov34/MPN/PAD-1 family protein [Methanobrevibacter cuticularis]KZX16281.1 Mov34/MPN/PAD-1 family protein [Methanobrevibacter cuticularis]